MNVVHLKLVDPASGHYVAAESACTGCSGCGDQGGRSVFFSGQPAADLQLELPTDVQYRLLWNSWLKPLLTSVVVAAGCATLELTESLSLVMVSVAFVSGLLICKVVPASALRLQALERSR